MCICVCVLLIVRLCVRVCVGRRCACVCGMFMRLHKKVAIGETRMELHVGWAGVEPMCPHCS